MSFHVDELLKIKEASSGFFKRKARYAISNHLAACKLKLQALEDASDEQRTNSLKKLMNEYTDQRHQALQNGASGYGDPMWGAASACEGWIHVLIFGEPWEIREYSLMVDKLIERK